MTDHGNKFSHFVEIVKKLRSEDGCPWDREQTPTSLKRYLREEVEEAIEAIASDNHQHIKEELGDVLYLIILITQIHDEKKLFNMSDVIAGITSKMIRRHPHVFSNDEIGSVADVRKKWQEIKDIEKSSGNNVKKN